MGEPVVQWT